MKNLSQIIKERVFILDGAMGTQLFLNRPTIDDYGSLKWEGCIEILNERRPLWIQKIHENYFNAGSDAVETNTFGCNELILSEFGLAHRTFEFNVMAVKLAREVACSYNEPKFVIGSVGPGAKLLTLGHVDYQSMFSSYYTQMCALIQSGVDAILIETAQDIGQIKLAIRAAHYAMKESHIQCPIWVQCTMELSGTTLLGSDISAILTAVEPLGIDVLGLNCGTGPDEFGTHLQYLSEHSPFAISCLPNAGLPYNDNGVLVYPQTPEIFVEKVVKLVKNIRINVVGGCCGTTPEHIKLLASCLKNCSLNARFPFYERSVSSLYSSVAILQQPPPLFVGERTNANGSKKFRDLLAINDYEGLVAIAREQVKEGAHVLDVCVACVGRNELVDMEEVVKRLATQVNIPLMIDSTELSVIEKALQIAPGKCIVNSINLENGLEKAQQILRLCKEYGASVVVLTIDEDGMAKSCERKIEIAKRLYTLVVNDFGLSPSDLCFDPLTFTLGSGDEDGRKSAIATLDAIAEIRRLWPDVHINLGLSNVSFGFHPYARQILNSIMLIECVKRGLDMAILNSSKILPLAKISEDDYKLAYDLIMDKRLNNYDPLKIFTLKHAGVKAKFINKSSERIDMTIEQCLQSDIIDGEKSFIVADLEQALKFHNALSLVNHILLPAMKIVGERFGAGELQLPFVLESAETMKIAIKELKPYLLKNQSFSKGKIVLATVKGDVHDIGKNLVDIILSNNGFLVQNLGIKKSIEEIYPYLSSEVDALGLSGLLVKSTVIMKENLEFLEAHHSSIPVILGGAALTRDFVENDCQKVYSGTVFYAEDTFEGLNIMESIVAKKGYKETLLQTNNLHEDLENEASIIVTKASNSTIALTSTENSSWVEFSTLTPPAPFYGIQTYSEQLKDVIDYLDDHALIRGRWGFVQGKMNSHDFEQILETKAKPIFKRLLKQILDEQILKPKVSYGYFKACSRGSELIIYDFSVTPDTLLEERKILAKINFPRQKNHYRLSISDFVIPEASGMIDSIALQAVTMGENAVLQTQKLHLAELFSEYFYFHGLCTELTEACAEIVHKKIRNGWGISAHDALSLRQLFCKSYQGCRYSFGYPACPNIEHNAIILDLLKASQIGIELSESFQMIPEYSTCAIVVSHPQARYFSIST